MTQLLVIRNGEVLTTHEPSQQQEIAGKYPDCEIVAWDGPVVRPWLSEEGYPPDPRSAEQKAADTRATSVAAVLATHAAEQEAGITMDNGWRMRYTPEAIQSYTEVLNLLGLASAGSFASIKIPDADGTIHTLTPAEVKAVLSEYAIKVGIEKQRQLDEVTTARNA